MAYLEYTRELCKWHSVSDDTILAEAPWNVINLTRRTLFPEKGIFSPLHIKRARVQFIHYL